MSARKIFSRTSPLMRILLTLGLLLSATAAQAIERVTYYHNDALGSPVAATDRNGTLLWRESYAPYGERLTHEAGSKDTVWYTGKPEEAAFGLNYFGARWYDPKIGRFMGVDPAGFSADNIHSFNRYVYANNNPYVYLDPDGKSALAIELGKDGAAAGTFICGPWCAAAGGVIGAGVGLWGTKELLGYLSEGKGDDDVPGLPDGLVGVQDDKSGDRGNRHVSGPLTPEHGGTGNAQDDFDHLTGGSGKPAPDNYPEGTRIGSNGIVIRPGTESKGPRIDIPAKGGKPHETLHY
jgi:RHS repeat-associated protein